MNHPAQSPGVELATALRRLVVPLGLDAPAWGDVLSGWAVGLEAGVAVKAIATGHYVYASAALAGMFGRSSAEVLLGRTDAELLGPDVAALLRAADLTAVTLGTPQITDHHIDRDRQRRDFTVTRVPMAPADAAAARSLCVIWHETTAARQRDAQLALVLKQLEQLQVASEQARLEGPDPLPRDTADGLFQNSQFDDQLRREVDLSSREHREFSLVSISIDAPLDVALALGAPARVRVVEAIGRLIRGNTRAMDASCRLSEHRFAVLLSGVGLATAHARMEGLRRQCATQIVVLDGQDFGFTVSMGVASFPHTARTQGDLVQASEAALAAAVARGGNHVALASIRFDGEV